MKVRDNTLKILVNNLSLRDYAYVTKDISNLEIEIERLNNIIDKIELALNFNIEYLQEFNEMKSRIDEDKEILRFIKELKEYSKK